MEAIGEAEYSKDRIQAAFNAGGPGAADFATFFAGIGMMPYYVPRITSTSDLLKVRLKAGEKPPSFLTCDSQTGGRGTGTRKWSDASGKDVLFSIAANAGGFPKKELFSIACGAAIASNMRELTGLDLGIKWPNDLVVSGKKLGGILIEMIYGDLMIIGVGINVRARSGDFPEGLESQATSIAEEIGGNPGKLHNPEFGIDRLPVLVAAAGGAARAAATSALAELEGFLDEYRKLDHTPGTMRAVNLGGKTVQAECRYVDFETGELVVRLPDGRDHRVSSASTALEDKLLQEL